MLRRRCTALKIYNPVKQQNLILWQDIQVIGHMALNNSSQMEDYSDSEIHEDSAVEIYVDNSSEVNTGLSYKSKHVLMQ